MSQDEQEALLGESASDFPFSDDLAVGTIGGGNHFAELQTVETVYRDDLLPAVFDSNRLQLLVHSGSRGLGQQILQRHIEAYGHRGLAEGSEAAADYLAEHQAALEFARLNRRLIAARMLDRWRTEGDCLLDVHHNFLEQTEIAGQTGWLHRKGATPADKGLVMNTRLARRLQLSGSADPRLSDFAEHIGTRRRTEMAARRMQRPPVAQIFCRQPAPNRLRQRGRLSG